MEEALQIAEKREVKSKGEKERFSSVQSLSRVRLLATPWITAHQASLSITAGVQPRLIQGIRRGDGFGEQDTMALFKY